MYWAIAGIVGGWLLSAVASTRETTGASGPLRQDSEGDWVFDNGHYALRFARRHGYAGVEVRIGAGSGERLDQYWTPELTFAPMCRMFDNVSLMDAAGGEIQGYLTMTNSLVTARATEAGGRPTLSLTGRLQRRSDGSAGGVQFDKTIEFHPGHYSATLTVCAPGGSEYRYADVWFDINDDWCNLYTNSAGDRLRLRPGIADSESAELSYRSMAQLDQGQGVWMSVAGPREEIRVHIATPDALAQFAHSGITFFDGPTEENPEADRHESHECMAISIIAGVPSPVVMEPDSVTFTYEVHFVPKTSVPEA